MADDKKKGVVQFNKPVEEVIRQRERSLTPEQAAAKARLNRMKQPRQPLGGAPEVSIPPLDAEPAVGHTMSAQAESLRDPTNPLSPAYDPELAAIAQQRSRQPSGGLFSPLPPDAAKHPGFRPGVGSMVKENQPALQDGYRPNLSQETLDSMKALGAFQSEASKVQEGNVVNAAKQNDPGTSPVDSETAELYQEIKQLLGDDKQWNKLNNPDRRKEVEDRLDPMNFTDIIIHGELRQDVPIRKGLTLTFRTVSGAEDLAVKRLMYGEKGGDRYMMDKFSMMQLALALCAVNGSELPNHLDEQGTFVEEKFLGKFDRVVKFPIQLIADMGLQYLWFHERVQDLLLSDTEELKNG